MYRKNQRLQAKPGASLDIWHQRIESALKNLGDRSTLGHNPLASLVYVKKYAAVKHPGRLLPRGLALHDILLACVKRVLTELNNEPALARACSYLELLAEGLSCKEISRQLGLSREHVSRVYRKKALELVTEEFLSTVKNGE